MSEQRLAKAFEAMDLSEILQARLALEAGGIPFVIEGELTGATEWLTSANGTVFRVAEDRVEEAKAAIREFLGGD